MFKYRCLLASKGDIFHPRSAIKNIPQRAIGMTFFFEIKLIGYVLEAAIDQYDVSQGDIVIALGNPAVNTSSSISAT